MSGAEAEGPPALPEGAIWYGRGSRREWLCVESRTTGLAYVREWDGREWRPCEHDGMREGAMQLAMWQERARAERAEDEIGRLRAFADMAARSAVEHARDVASLRDAAKNT